MSQKRIRSYNWDEEEKHLLRSVLRKYASIIENKSLDANTNKVKNKAWEEVHRKFNELNGRRRDLMQLKIQWKTMKINARKTYRTSKTQNNKTGGGARPITPTDVDVEIKGLLNPAAAELLQDQNPCDSDDDYSSILSPSANEATLESANETSDISLQVCQDGTSKSKKFVLNDVTETGLKSRKDYNNYPSSMISHSKMLKEDEHKRRMRMAEEDHTLKMAILKEKLKYAILEREILEIQKKREEKSFTDCN